MGPKTGSRYGILTLAFLCTGTAQTLVDLRTQSKSIDFTAANSTKPFQLGTTLPATCALGQAFFDSNAPAGSNLYLCVAQNSWALEVGTPGATGSQGATGPQGATGSQGATGAPGTNGTNGAIAHIQNGGVSLPVESALNFTAGGCTDDPTNGRTDCNGAGISGLTVASNGVTEGTQSTLNLISGNGVVEVCVNNSGASRVDCTPALDTTYAPTRSMDQQGTDRSIIATSGGAGGTFISNGTPTATGYFQNQTFSFIASDHASAGNDTLNVDTLGPIPLKKASGATLVAIAANDLQQNTPYLLRAHGSPVDSFIVYPENVNWTSDVVTQSVSQAAVTLASAPGAGPYVIQYYANQNGTCTSGSNSVNFTLSWTDAGSARTFVAGPLTLGSAQATSAYLSGTLSLYVGSGNVTYSSTVSGSCTTGTSSYDTHMTLLRPRG
jgi:hypothetical protein